MYEGCAGKRPKTGKGRRLDAHGLFPGMDIIRIPGTRMMDDQNLKRTPAVNARPMKS